MGEHIPNHPVTTDAAGEYQPQQRHAGKPGEPARAAVTIHYELARQVQHHDDDQGVGGIAVQAAHDAAGVPLNVAYIFKRRIRLIDAGVEKDVKVDAADDDNPVEEPAQCAEVAERVPRRGEGAVEYLVCALKGRFGSAAQAAHLLLDSRQLLAWKFTAKLAIKQLVSTMRIRARRVRSPRQAR